MFPKFILAIILSALLSYFFTPLIRNYFIKKKWVEDPAEKQKKTNNATAQAILPRGGGLPVFLAILLTSLIFLPLDKHLVGILLASSLVIIVGLFDDIKDISPHFRLATNILAALFVVAFGIGIAYISNPLGGVIDLSWPRITLDLFGSSRTIWVLSDLLAIFWIVWCMNTVGWAAGVEGQLPGFVAISALIIGILGLRYSSDVTQWPVIILAGSVAGAYLGFLPFNFFPQSIMPGYSGKSLAGFLLALLAILSGAKLATLVLLLSIPMLDAIFVIVRRLYHRRSIFHSDGSHLHHQLLKIGVSRRQITFLYWSLTLFFGVISLFLSSQQKFYMFLGVSLMFFGLITLIYRRT